MSAYTVFAFYYDALTKNVDYRGRADYLCRLLEYLGHCPGITLDLACGTGSLTLELARRGWDVYGIDGSMEMLSVAKQKASDAGMDLLFLCQKMQRIDLYGTVDTVVCALDSINHLTSEKDVQDTFQRVSLFLAPGGYFIFDLNTPYKHREVLGNEIFLYDTDEVFCAWQNHYDPKTLRTRIVLDFFGRDGEIYHRATEQFYERAYPLEQIREWLNQAGLELTAVYGDQTFSAPSEKEERVVVVAHKANQKVALSGN